MRILLLFTSLLLTLSLQAADVLSPLNSTRIEFITVSNYSDFLNAVAAVDPHQLYDERMGADPDHLIIRTSDENGYHYSIAPENALLPMIYISESSEARYDNWVYNGQRSGEDADESTETGIYTLSDNFLIASAPRLEATAPLLSEKVSPMIIPSAGEVSYTETLVAPLRRYLQCFSSRQPGYDAIPETTSSKNQKSSFFSFFKWSSLQTVPKAEGNGVSNDTTYSSMSTTRTSTIPRGALREVSSPLTNQSKKEPIG